MAELIDAVKIVRQDKIKPIVSKTFPLEEAETALQMILANKTTGRVVWVI